MEFRRGFKAEANRIAVSIRQKMLLAPTDPINPDHICDMFDIEVIPLSQINTNCSPFLNEHKTSFSALTVRRGIKTAIVHNDSHNIFRQRSNICHELAHCFLGHQGAPPLTESGQRHHDGGIEAEANYLAGALLLTNEGAIHILRNALLPIAQRTYGISRPMLDYRLRVSGALAIHGRGSQSRALAD